MCARRSKSTSKQEDFCKEEWVKSTSQNKLTLSRLKGRIERGNASNGMRTKYWKKRCPTVCICLQLKPYLFERIIWHWNHFLNVRNTHIRGPQKVRTKLGHQLPKSWYSFFFIYLVPTLPQEYVTQLLKRKIKSAAGYTGSYLHEIIQTNHLLQQ